MEAGAHISYSEAKAKAEEDRLQNQELKKKKQLKRKQLRVVVYRGCLYYSQEEQLLLFQKHLV